MEQYLYLSITYHRTGRNSILSITIQSIYSLAFPADHKKDLPVFLPPIIIRLLFYPHLRYNKYQGLISSREDMIMALFDKLGDILEKTDLDDKLIDGILDKTDIDDKLLKKIGR